MCSGLEQGNPLSSLIMTANNIHRKKNQGLLCNGQFYKTISYIDGLSCANCFNHPKKKQSNVSSTKSLTHV